jgi:hypothetical protein
VRKLPGNLCDRWRRITYSLRPGAGETAAMLADLQRRLGCAGLALVLAVPVMTLRRWQSGRGTPTAAGIRAIWLLWCLVLHPDRLRSVLSVATWGRFEEQRAARLAGEGIEGEPAPGEDWSI